MLSFRNVFLLFCSVLAISGLLAWMLVDRGDVSKVPPGLTSNPPVVSEEVPRQTSAADVLGPWGRTPTLKVRTSAPTEKVVPAPDPVLPAPVVVADSQSVRLIGQMTGEDDVRVYLFKYLPTGQVLRLTEGIEANRWRLTSVFAEKFVLEGPGGMYEVSR